MTMRTIEWINVAAGTLGGVAAYLWGPWDALIIALVCAVALDYVSGVAKAFVNKQLNSSVGLKGLVKKVFIFAVVALGCVVDRLIPATNEAIRAAVIIFYTANEGLSILENAGEIGLPLPKALKNALSKLSSEERIDQ